MRGNTLQRYTDSIVVLGSIPERTVLPKRLQYGINKDESSAYKNTLLTSP